MLMQVFCLNCLIFNLIYLLANGYGNTPLHEACHHRNLEVSTFLLKHGANVNATNHKGSTPLHTLCYTINSYHGMDLLKLLIDSGANVNHADNRGMTPILVCCTSGRYLMHILFLLRMHAYVCLEWSLFVFWWRRELILLCAMPRDRMRRPSPSSITKRMWLLTFIVILPRSALPRGHLFHCVFCSLLLR